MHFSGHFEGRFSGIFIIIFRDCSGQKNCFCVNFPILGPSGPRDPEKGRKIAKKVEKDRKNQKKQNVLERRLDKWLWAFFRPIRQGGGTTKRPFLKIPGAPARRGNASRELVKKGPVFENSWRPCEARQGLAESLSFPPPGLPPYSGSRIPSVFRLPNGEILYDRLKMAAIRRMGFHPKVERSM